MHIIKVAMRNIPLWLSPINWISSLLASIHCSFANWQPILVTRKGYFWYYYGFRQQFRVAYTYLTFPFSSVRTNIPIFTKHYQPTLGDVVVDLGSGDGAELQYWSRCVGPSGRVVSIEPSALNCATQMELVDRLHLDNVSVVNALVGDRQAVVPFDFHVTNVDNRRATAGLSGLLLSSNLDYILNELGISDIDYVKINIEGDEQVVAPSLEVTRYKNLCISCHDFTGDEDQRTFEFITSWALKSGYHVVEAVMPTSSVDAEDYYVYLVRPN
jgi:FkbM family methyltransferase